MMSFEHFVAGAFRPFLTSFPSPGYRAGAFESFAAPFVGKKLTVLPYTHVTQVLLENTANKTRQQL
jgi:hypothetical protein